MLSAGDSCLWAEKYVWTASYRLEIETSVTVEYADNFVE